MNEVINELKYKNSFNNIKNKINTFFNKSNSQKQKILKEKELIQKQNKFFHNNEYYINKIYFSKEKNCLDSLDLEIIFCDGDKELHELWNYFKVMTSSAITSDKCFGSIKYMIKDKITNKYLGIVELSNDIYSCGPRDKFIGWTPKIKKKKVNIINNLEKSLISFIINISCCIGLQPMAYNLNIGKLLVASVFSNEVQDYFYKLRGYKCACVTTFGLYGKSVQYDKMKEIKFIGKTKGTGTCVIPDDLYQDMVLFMKEYHSDIYKKSSQMSSPKLRNIQYCLNILNIEQSNILFHGQQRGIYIGFTSNESKKFLNGDVDKFNYNEKIRPFKVIVEWWKNRWSQKRIENLFKNNKYKIKYELKNFTLKEKKNQYNRQYQFEKMQDIDFLKNKRENAKQYYYDNKNKLLTIAKEELLNNKNHNYYLDDYYLGGFFDADGSIYISNNSLVIHFSQCVLNVLLSIQEKFGGNIYKQEKKNKNSRNQYNLKINGEKTKKILEVLNNTSILKASKIKKALLYLNYINKSLTKEKEDLIHYLKFNKKEDNNEFFNRINIKYISGLFDGDGSVYLNNSKLKKNNLNVRVTIVQKYTPYFLEYLKIYLSKELNTHIGLSSDRIYFESTSGLLIFYKLINHLLIVKKFQFSKMIDLINLYKEDKINNMEKIKLIALEIQQNKHEDIEYDLDIQKLNIIEDIKNNIENKQNNIEITDENHLKTIIIQKHKKKGLFNNNYGKQLNDEHICKISTEISKIKRTKNQNLTNEKIEEIYNLKGKKLQKDVASMYNMNREMIRRIWNDELLPTNHPNFYNNVLIKKNKIYTDPKIATSIGKRSLETHEYIDILLWKIKKNNNELLNSKKITSTKLANKLSNQFNKNITNDIIKNIWSGRTKLFDFDFKNQNKISYEEYKILINK